MTSKDTLSLERKIPTFRFHTVNQHVSLIKAYAYHLWSKEDDVGRFPEYTVDILASHETKDEISLLLGCAPSPISRGLYVFKYQNRLTKVEICESSEFKSSGTGLAKWSDTHIYITADTLTDAEETMTKFINDAMEYTRKKDDESSISVQIYDSKVGWRYISELPRRPLDTIYIDEKEKDRLVRDINSFISEEEDYHQLGIPYKRCYLFHGPPGSGKTSTIFAIASMLNKGISIFNFSAEISDTAFTSAISQIPTDRILVFEDIDGLFAERTPTGTNCVSFSSVLNVLDGVCRKEGLMTFVTTNHIKRLDSALLRPGRVDFVMEFSFVTKPQIRQMYYKFRPNLGNEKEFRAICELLHKKKVGMSLVQQFLFTHRRETDISEKINELYKLIDAHEEREVGVYS